MFPVRDLAPTRVFPIVTVLLIGLNALAYFAWQPLHDPGAAASFLYERASIACEITTGDPLTIREIVSGRCSATDTGLQAFPEKRIALSVVVSLFLHGSVLHLAGNMWFLWIFGNNVEEAFGRLRFAALYLAGGVVATLGFVWLNPASTEPLIGASGAVAAALGAYLVLFPRHWIVSLIVFYVTPVPAVAFLGLWFVGQFAVGDSAVAWQAHVVGFAFGMAIATVLRGPLVRRVREIHAGRRTRT